MIDPSTTSPDHELATRQRLLEAAGEVFSEKGFHDTTIREICGRAGANVAAVNYHFGDKAELYKQVLRYADKCAAHFSAVSAASSGNADAPMRLRMFIRAYVAAMLDAGRSSWHGRLIAREMMEPSPALSAIIEENIRPRSQMLGELLRELLGPSASDEQVIRCKFSIIGQCVMYHAGRHIHQRLHPGYELRAETVTAIADHIADFSLSALAEMKQHNLSGGSARTRGGDE